MLSGIAPTADSRNIRQADGFWLRIRKKQRMLLEYVCKYVSRQRSLRGKNLKEMMGMEGYRVRQIYEEIGRKIWCRLAWTIISAGEI